MFKEMFVESKGFDLKDLIKILNTEGYDQYKNKVPNRMHEYHNKGIIVSMGTDNGGKSMNIFRVRDYDKNNGKKFTPKTLEEFTKIIRNRTLEGANSSLTESKSASLKANHEYVRKSNMPVARFKNNYIDVDNTERKR